MSLFVIFYLQWMQHGVTINNVGPGVFASPTAIENYGPLAEVMFGNMEKTVPAGHLGDIERHLVAPILFMMSSGVNYTTGQSRLEICVIHKLLKTGFKISYQLTN